MQSGGGFRLTVRRGPQPNQTYELTKDILSIGRDITNDITINDPEVSRHHCRLTRGGGGYTLEDLGSTNGTFVNGQRLTGARPLTSGDLIGFGETVSLIYEAASMAGAAARDPYQARQQQATMVGASSQDPYYNPAQQPAPGYVSAPPPPAPAYSYQDDVAPAGGAGRWLFLGCGCFIVLCIIFSVIAIILIDSTCSWDSVPILSDLLEALGFTVNEAACT
jgi:hypothetical protein